MASEPWPVVVKASRSEIIEMVVHVKADSKSTAEALALAHVRRQLQGQLSVPAGAQVSRGRWHVLDAVPADVPRPG